jgi:hypothetical protein
MASATFIGGALLDAEKGAFWRGSTGGYVGWLLARLEVGSDHLLLAPTVGWLFRERSALKDDVDRVERAALGVRIVARGIPGHGFVFWPLPWQRASVLRALAEAGYPVADDT